MLSSQILLDRTQSRGRFYRASQQRLHQGRRADRDGRRIAGLRRSKGNANKRGRRPANNNPGSSRCRCTGAFTRRTRRPHRRTLPRHATSTRRERRGLFATTANSSIRPLPTLSPEHRGDTKPYSPCNLLLLRNPTPSKLADNSRRERASDTDTDTDDAFRIRRIRRNTHVRQHRGRS